MRKWFAIVVGVVCGTEVLVAVVVGGGLAAAAGWEAVIVAGSVGFVFVGSSRTRRRRFGPVTPPKLAEPAVDLPA